MIFVGSCNIARTRIQEVQVVPQNDTVTCAKREFQIVQVVQKLKFQIIACRNEKIARSSLESLASYGKLTAHFFAKTDQKKNSQDFELLT